ncbi:MAG TPA: c-type cytochrome [Vicinamibacterales bacterium]|nr:c-type cytochrome [Vicinamibacterales bacterium]
MRNFVLAAAAAVLTSAIYSGVAAQGPPAGGAPPGGRGQGPGGRGGQTFPNRQRQLADPAIIQRGNALYGINCRLCHGADLRGGDLGGVNLLRSALVLSDKEGEQILPVVKEGRQRPGMPPMPPLPLADDDIKAIAAYIHSVAATMAGQGGPPPGPPVELNIVVGDPAAGQRYFAANCASCHSPTGDLQGLASRYPSPMQLQNTWVGGVSQGFGRGGGAAGNAAGPARVPKPVTVVVTTADGQRYEGRLDRIDDFIVSLTQADGTPKTFRRNGSVPAVQITDPLEAHKKMLVKYTDKDIHDVTAYLVTLK